MIHMLTIDLVKMEIEVLHINLSSLNQWWDVVDGVGVVYIVTNSLESMLFTNKDKILF